MSMIGYDLFILDIKAKLMVSMRYIYISISEFLHSTYSFELKNTVT